MRGVDIVVAMRGLTLPEPPADLTADPSELYFDLAFVFAFSQLVWVLVHYPTWADAGRTAVLFVIMWMLPWA